MIGAVPDPTVGDVHRAASPWLTLGSTWLVLVVGAVVFAVAVAATVRRR